MKQNELLVRILVGVVLIPLFIFLIFIGKIPFLIAVIIILVVSLLEFYQMMLQNGYFPSQCLGLATTIVIALLFYFKHGKFVSETLLFFLLLSLFVELFKKRFHPLANIGMTIFGVLYISFLSSFILIRQLPLENNLSYTQGGFFVIYIFSVIWLCDTSAYLIGSTFGKHAMFERVSPKKTWEGALGGFFIGILSALILKMFLLPDFTFINSLIIGLIICIMGQFSDLIESLFKRDMRVKDSSSIIPGHGGVLDRFDSSLLVGPIVYFYLKFFVL